MRHFDETNPLFIPTSLSAFFTIRIIEPPLKKYLVIFL